MQGGQASMDPNAKTENAIVNVQECIRIVSVAVENLENRLRMVLRPKPGQDVARGVLVNAVQKIDDPRIPAPIQQGLANLEVSLAGLNAQVNELLDRVDL